MCGGPSTHESRVSDAWSSVFIEPLGPGARGAPVRPGAVTRVATLRRYEVTTPMNYTSLTSRLALGCFALFCGACELNVNLPPDGTAGTTGAGGGPVFQCE